MQHTQASIYKSSSQLLLKPKTIKRKFMLSF